MTFDDFAATVAGIAGTRGSAATQDARRYTTGRSETRWTAWIATREEGPGVLVDGATPEEALEKLRAGLAERGRVFATVARTEEAASPEVLLGEKQGHSVFSTDQNAAG